MIDIGVNLTNPQFEGKIDAVLKRAKDAGIEQIVITGTDIESSQQAAQLCEEFCSGSYPQLSSTAGIHPHDASQWNADTEHKIRSLLEPPQVVAVGETGLDFNRNFSTPDEQAFSFTKHLEIACEINKPLFLHERDAFDKQTEILKSFGGKLPPVVIHCFTGNQKNLHSYLEMGFYIGITGWVCDERRGTELAEIVSDIPLDRLMIETDAPYLLPRNIRSRPKSRTNEPSYLTWVVKKLAECYDTSEETIATNSSENARLFFGLNT